MHCQSKVKNKYRSSVDRKTTDFNRLCLRMNIIKKQQIDDTPSKAHKQEVFWNSIWWQERRSFEADSVYISQNKLNLFIWTTALIRNCCMFTNANGVCWQFNATDFRFWIIEVKPISKQCNWNMANVCFFSIWYFFFRIMATWLDILQYLDIVRCTAMHRINFELVCNQHWQVSTVYAVVQFFWHPNTCMYNDFAIQLNLLFQIFGSNATVKLFKKKTLETACIANDSNCMDISFGNYLSTNFGMVSHLLFSLSEKLVVKNEYMKHKKIG